MYRRKHEILSQAQISQDNKSINNKIKKNNKFDKDRIKNFNRIKKNYRV